MAKGSFLGVKRGKLGDAVGYNVTNSNDKDKQGWRVYQPVVSNPQTDGQIDQRVKMAAVNNLYRALKPIIQRGWENKKYGDESRRAFLKKALSASFEGPYLEKGSTLAVPIKNVPIMYGSLPPVQMVCDNGEIWFMNVIVPSGVTTITVGDISRLFISSDLALEGDQVTLVLGYLTELGIVSYRTISFYVNPADGRVANTLGVGFGSDQFEGISRLVIDDIPDNVFSIENCCVLCSISRDGDGSHLRSYAEFTMSDTFENYFYGDAATKESRAKSSYRKNVSANTNWEQNPDVGPLYGFTAKRGDGTVIVPVAVTISQAGYTIVEDSQSNLLYVKGTDVRAVSYNRWLKAKNGTVLSDVWNQTAPAELEPDQYISFVASDTATADDISFYNFLLAAGYDSRALMGVLPQS